MTKKVTPPSLEKAAFDCPHCEALTTQYWFHVYADEHKEDNSTPFIPNEKQIEAVQNSKDIHIVDREEMVKNLQKVTNGLLFLYHKHQNLYGYVVGNLFISKCFSCNKIAVWMHDNIIFPPKKEGVMPNQDLPDDIIKDFEEARSIVGLSPRGAAALLRLCIQKLCKSLGEKGKNLNNDIASLVIKGLNPVVKDSLDIVRVIGGEAVHPGTIDLNDNRDIANTLFDLVNSIADQMITHPKHVKETYKKLPATKRKAIEDRDGIADKK